MQQQTWNATTNNNNKTISLTSTTNNALNIWGNEDHTSHPQCLDPKTIAIYANHMQYSIFVHSEAIKVHTNKQFCSTDCLFACLMDGWIGWKNTQHALNHGHQSVFDNHSTVIPKVDFADTKCLQKPIVLLITIAVLIGLEGMSDTLNATHDGTREIISGIALVFGAIICSTSQGIKKNFLNQKENQTSTFQKTCHQNG